MHFTFEHSDNKIKWGSASFQKLICKIIIVNTDMSCPSDYCLLIKILQAINKQEVCKKNCKKLFEVSINTPYISKLFLGIISATVLFYLK